MTAFAARLGAHATSDPGRTAVVAGDRRVTYGALATAVARVAGGLAAAGIAPGDVVTSRLPNGIEALVLCLAANRLGAVHNPLTTSSRAHEVEFVRAQSRSAVFVDGTDDRLLHEDAPPAPIGARRDGAPAFLVYTSGSTAEPKGVLHSDRTLWAECEAQAAYHGLGNDEIFVMPSPVAHVSGLIYGVLLPIWLGATSVLMARWDPDEFLVLVGREHGTFSAGATPFLAGALDAYDPASHDVSSLRVFPCGGADVPPALIREATERLGVRTGRGYGSSEFPSITSAAGPDEPLARRAETDGRPIGANEVRVRGGEIQARGPELFLGYLDAALDRDVFTEDGWLRTGDLGTLDGEGYLTVTGRAKDVVIRLGEKISAREVEDLLGAHPAVAGVAVVAIPDARTGEHACACVVPRAGAAPPTLDDLCRFLAESDLSRRKLPEQLVVLDALPMTPSGKVDKQALRARVTCDAPWAT